MSLNEITSLTFEIKKGSQQHFKLFVHKTQGIVYNVCKAMGLSPEDTQEVIQDTYVQFWRQRHTIEERNGVLGLLKIIAKRLVYKKVNSAKQTVPLQESKVLKLVDTAEPHTKVDVSLLKKYVNQLPNTQGTMIRLFYFDGLSGNEIATHLNVSIRTVENTLYKAKKKLRVLFESDGLDPNSFLKE